MKLPSLAIVVATFVAVATGDSGAQTPRPAPTPGVEPDRVAPAPRPITAARAPQPAPWQRLDPDPAKRQYYVYRQYAPADVAARLDQPITDSAYRELLARRAASFRSGSKSLRLAIDPDAILDVGTTRPEDTSTVALVDLDRSPDLRAMVHRDLRVDERQSYVIPFLSSAVAREAGATPAYRSHDSLIVSVAAKDHSRVAVWRFADGRWQRVSEVTAKAAATRDPQTLVNRLRMPRERAYFGGFRQVVQAQAAVQQPTVASVTSNELVALFQRLQVQDPGDKDAKAAAEAKQEEQTAAAQPARYTAYGKSALCNRHCSSPACVGCCATVKAAEEAHIGGIAFACHVLSDLCPWCHAGCAANTAFLLSIALTQFIDCTVKCGQPQELLASQGNPRNCPVH